MVKQSQPIKSGVGHQFTIDQRSFGSCRSNIENAMMSILDQKNENPDAKELFFDLSKCFEKAIALEMACKERFEQSK